MMKVNKTLIESANDTVVLGWGRMNPPTIGHKKLVDTISKNGSNAKLYLSHTQDSTKNPLSYDSKIKWAQKAFGDKVDVVNSNAKTIIDVLKELSQAGFKNLIYVGGEDRIGGDEDITQMIMKYNGQPNKKGEVPYNFDNIKFINAGSRDDSSDDLVTKASASLARKLASENNLEEFKQIVPFNDTDAEKLFKEVKSGLNINECVLSEAQTDIVGKITIVTDTEEKDYDVFNVGGKFSFGLLMGQDRFYSGWANTNIISFTGKINDISQITTDDVTVDSGDGRHVRFTIKNNGQKITFVGRSGQGRGSAGFSDKITTIFQEVIMGLILNGKLSDPDIKTYLTDSVYESNGTYRLQNVFDLGLKPVLNNIDSSYYNNWQVFVKSWGDSLQTVNDSVHIFYETADTKVNWGVTDITTARLLHPYYLDGKFINKKDVYDKSDVYLCRDESVINTLNSENNPKRYCELMESYVAQKKILGVSLKRPSGKQITCEFDFEGFNSDSVSEEAFCQYHYTKTTGRIKTVNLRFIGINGEHYPILEVRSDSDSDNSNLAKFAIQWKFNKSQAWAGKGKEAFKYLFGDTEYERVKKAASEHNYIKCANIILQNIGFDITPDYLPQPDENLSITTDKQKSNITQFMNLSMGYNGKDLEGNRITAPYIKVY